jgi:hypothetical protein
MKRPAFVAGSLAAACYPLAAAAQARNLDDAIVGKWASTLNGTDSDRTPPLKYAETVTLTISANGNLYLERLTRPLNSKNADLWLASGIYSVPVPGVLRLTFNPEYQLSAAIWRYSVSGNKFVIVDNDTNVSRTFVRIFTAIY